MQKPIMTFPKSSIVNLGNLCLILNVAILFLCTTNASAQYNILYTDGNNNPLLTDDISVCQSEVFYNTARIIIGSNSADNSSFTITMPPGVEYVPGCMSVLNTNAGITVTESNISDLNSPVFTLQPSDLSAGDQVTIQYCRVADCAATAHQMNGGTFKDEIEVCGDAGCTIDDDPSLNSYDLMTPSLSMSSDGPITAQVGTNVCRNITLTNGGQGYLDSIKYYTIDGTGTTTTSMTTVPTGTVLTPIVNGDTLCYWLTGAILAEFGNGDNFMDNGEQILLERCYDVDNCDNASFYGSYWGCPGSCMSTDEIMQQTNIPNDVPNLSFGFKNGVNRDFCFKGQNAVNGGTAVIQTFELCNTGAGPATNIAFELYNNTPGSGTGQNYFTEEPANIFDSASNPLGTSTSQTGIYNGSYYQADCSLEQHPAAVDYELGGIVVLPGECITVELPSYANNKTQECDGECNADLAWYYFNRSYSYQDGCEINNYSRARAGIAYGGRQLYRYDIDMPTDMRDCDEFDLQVNYSNFYNNTKSSTEGSTELKIDVSNTGLLYQGNGAEVFKGVSVNVVQVGDTICVTYPHNAIPNGAGVLALPLKATCTTGSGTKSIRLWHEGQYDNNCPGSKYHLKCLSRTYVMHCPNPCPEGGATPQLFTLERISLGLEDLDNNGVPDGTGTAKPEDVQLHRASNCDTVKGTWEIYVFPNTLGDNAGVPFNHLYVEFDLNDLNLDCTYFETDNLFEPLPDAVATIFPADGSASYTCTVTPTIEDTPGSGVDDLAKYDLSSCKATWEAGDSIVFCANYVVTTSYHSSSFNQYVADNEVYSSYIPNPAGVNPSDDNKYTCDKYNDFMNVYRHYFSPYTPTPQTINGCEGRLLYYLRYYINTQTGDVWYPNEYRPFTIPDKFTVELDDALAFRPGSVNFAGQAVPDADVTQMGNMLTICNLKQFFQGYGGPLLESDETWSYLVQFKIDPTCEAETGIYRTRFNGQVIGNGCHSPDMNYTAVSNCSNTTGWSAFGQVNYDGPQPFLTGGGTVQFTSGQACWDVILNNGSNNIDAPFTWFQLEGGSNYMVLDDTGTAIPPDANGFYQLGDNPASNSSTYRICANGDQCDTTKINVLSGFGCTAYPDGMEGLSCAETVELIGLPLMSEVQLGIESEPVTPMPLCETQAFELKKTSAQSAFLDDPKLSILSPPGATISNIMVEYPCGSGNMEPAISTTNGNFILIDVEAHSAMGTGGMPGTVDALAPEQREACITFDLDTDCDFLSSSGLIFQAFGNRPCGDPAINNGVRVRSSDLTIEGVSQPHGAAVTINSEFMEVIGCDEGNEVEVNIDFVSLGSNFSSASDSVTIILDPNVEFLPGTFQCCSTDPDICPTFGYSETDANGFTTVVLAFPSTPFDLSTNPSMCFTYEVVNSSASQCDQSGNMNVSIRASAGNVPCPTVPGGVCPNLQTVTGQKDINFTTEKIELQFSEPNTFSCESDGSLTYDLLIAVDSLGLAAGEILVLDIYCTTASGTTGTYIQSDVINGPVSAGTIVNITGTVPSGSCNTDFGISAVIGDPNQDRVAQCICEPLILNSGPLDCPAELSHTKEFTSLTETAPGEYDIKWTITVTNSGFGDGLYNLNDIPGFDDDIEICDASYSTTDAIGNPGNPGSLMLGLDGVFELAADQFIGSGDVNTYCLIVKIKYDPVADPAIGDGIYTACESASNGDPTSGEGLYNQSQLDTNDDGIADQTDETCQDLPCKLSITSVVPTNCMPTTGLYNLDVSVVYISGPDCLIDIGGQTFVIDGSGNETFTVTGLAANGATGVMISSFFTCEASCFDTAMYDSPEACSALTCSASKVDVLCNGEATGSAIVTAGGGTAPYIYSWNSTPAQNTATASGLVAGTYNVTVTDADNSTTTCEVTITQPTAMTCSVVKDNDITCNGDGDGGATVTASGGTPGYTYAWTGGEMTPTAMSLDVGVNTVVVTDNNNCTTECTVTIIEPAVVSCTITATTDPLCAGESTGTITVSGSGGTGALLFSLDGGPTQSGGSFNTVNAGAHTVTVTDANGCTSSCSATLTDPPALSCTTAIVQMASCDMDDGSATVSPAGGTPGYTYLWDNTEITATATALSAGTHTVTVTDTNNCTTTCQVVITSTDGLTCEISNSNNVSCNGAGDGAATTVGMGGTTPYTYLWNTGATTAAISSLPGGNYVVTLTDAVGCEAICAVEIIEATALLCSIVKDNDITCNGAGDGGATVTASGGTPGYTYAWTGGETTPSATSLDAGLNTVTITDANNCTTTCTIEIIEPVVLSCAVDGFTNPLCAEEASGTITVSGAGGTSTLMYSLDGAASQMSGTFTSVLAGPHTITVTDVNGCTTTCSQTLTDPAALSCTVSATQMASCGMSDGQATVTATGGTPAYSYLWDNTETTSTATALSAGSHTVTVTDDNGCETECIVVITTTAGLTCEFTSTTNVSCNGAADGSATVAASGGTSPYTYTWSSGQTTAAISNLSGALYTVTITDNTGCTAVCSTTISEATALTCIMEKNSDITCNGQTNGVATVTASGGTPGYTYAWSSSENTPTATMLSEGTNSVTVTDANNCITVCTVEILEPSELICSLSMEPSGCQGQDDGEVTVTVVGGTAPYMYSINGGTNQTGDVFSNLAPGNYDVVVTDVNACVSTACSIEVTVTGCIYDLSLVKGLSPGQTGVYDPTDEVTFRITVCNQGQINADNIEVTDYIPSGLSFVAAHPINVSNGWTMSAAGYATTLSVAGGQLPAGGLAGNDCVFTEIVLSLDANAPQGTQITNFAEISDDDGDDVDSTADDDDSNDGPATNDVTDGSNDDEDDHDPAIIITNYYDLALSKTLAAGQATAIAPGDDVTFTITVYNQGTIAADNIEITDYIPACMTNVDPDWMASASGVSYTMSVANNDLPSGGLLPSAFAQVDITLNVNTTANSACDLTNFAEISNSTDTGGTVLTDVDSTPDDIDGNDVYAGDDEVDNANGDEDDHDPASVELLPYDLALSKSLSPGQSSAVAPGDLVTYDITVINQGNYNAYTIEITDYVPACMTLVDTDWSGPASGPATYVMDVSNVIPAGGLLPMGSVTVPITLQLDNPVGSTCDLTNVAEISNDDGDDTDSDPDDINGNDPADEDDIDDEVITILGFDLALTKDLAAGQAANVAPGDLVTYTITVINQGAIPADNIVLVDYIPSCMTLSDANWMMVNGNPQYTMTVAAGDLPAGGLPPMASASYDITLQLANPVPSTCDLTNFAEIGSATDEDGMPQDDSDSTPDDTLGNDPAEEDDIDDAVVELLGFDLALTKDLAASQASSVAPGDLVTYTITILNQGDIPADNIVLVDYIPSCMTLSDANWMMVNGNPQYTMTVANGDLPAGGLLPMASASYDITLQLANPVPSTCDLTNVAEIVSATDEDGMPQEDEDSTPDDTEGNDAPDEDDNDDAVIELLGFDLALTKDLAASQASNVAPGDLVIYTITILNQGDIPADNIVLVDYIPSCMTLSDANWMMVNGNPQYTMTVANGDFPAGGLLPMASASYDITLQLANPVPSTCDLTNVAEIVSATDEDGMPQEDEDSTPDDTEGNDAPDEDDNDDAVIELLGFDLALTKDLAASQASNVAPGDLVTYTITILNQGDIPADNIVLVDYIPSCMTLSDANWMMVNGNPQYTMTVAAGDLPAGGLPPMASASYDITLQLANPVPSTCDLTNVAEIVSATDEDGMPQEDEDSTPDDTEGNDAPDEDDNDDAIVELLDFDLALTKDLAAGQASSVAPGDLITYTITILNQGDIPADNIVLVDYIPSCMTLSDANWMMVNGNPQYTMTVANGDLPAGGLLPMASASYDITLQLANPVPSTCDLTNVAEIVSATDEDGMPQEDEDSTPDDTEGNDAPDEDDNDDAVIELLGFDLALTKDLAASQASNVAPGDLVIYTITILNQGDIPADNIVLVDYIPSCMTLSDASWMMVNGNPQYTMTVAAGDLPAGGLPPMASASYDITLQLANPVPSTCDLTNVAEIVSATDEDGMPQEDEDSTPDDTEGNDAPDEDDNDDAIVELLDFDLALTKDLAAGQASSVAPGDLVTYTITILNQGDIPADNIVLVDYIPSCMTLSDANWMMVNGNPQYTMTVAAGDLPAGGLPPMGTASYDITLQLANPVPSTCDLTNVAEIVSATDEDGMPQEDEDSTPDDTEGNDAPDEDDNDDAIVELLDFDLALTKDLAAGQASSVAPGDLITYTITILNQGDIPADNILLVDYMPSCMTLSDADWMMVNGNPQHTMTVAAGDLPTGGLQPMGTATYDITLQLANPVPSTCDLTNFAEIGSATDEDGMPQEDEDSTPDDIIGNDPVDEDDIDDAIVDVLIFDLALNKSLAVGQSDEVMIGDDVTFTFTILNQGEITADNIQISDYIPADFVLNDTDWTNTNPPTTTLSVANGRLPAGGLTPNGMATVDITLTVQMTAVDGDTYVNVGEISSATDEDGMLQDDIDSDPDNNPNNDPSNEDDIDDAEVVIMGDCDLALQKICSGFESNADGTGGQMTFDIIIINQGSCAAYDVGIIDYILPHDSWSLNDNDWYQSPFDGYAYYTIPGPILSGTSDTVQITFDITSFDIDDTPYNWAEIFTATDFNGDDLEDMDSDFDYNPSNDGPPFDNVIDNSFNDEDDHDFAEICIPDLALDKRLDASMMPPYAYGDQITFNICITNEGNTTFNTTTVADNIPAGFTYDPALNADWTGSGPVVTHTFAGPIAPGDELCVDIVLEFTSGGMSADDYTNVSEITEATDENGDVTSEDWDSTPNNDDGDQSEDDEDAEVFRVFDLALSKTTTDLGPFTYGQDVTFDITIHNQGSIPAHDVTIVDYLPCGYEFISSAGWTEDPTTGYLQSAIDGPIMPGTPVSVPLIVRIVACSESAAWVNYSEITGGNDEFGMTGNDLDSDPDSIDDNDGPVEDNDIDGTNSDEDDHDLEEIQIYDLALQKVIDDRGPYLPGEVVEFKIRLYNQGNVDATDIEITDYLNDGFLLTPGGANTGWITAGAYAAYTYAGPLTPGSVDSVSLFLEITIPADATLESWYNEAEISGGNGTDADSNADNDPNNDNDVLPGDDDDNEISEHGNGDDEDDNDVADVLVTGEIGDKVWKDIDGDGIQDAGEAGVAGVIVTLSDCIGNVIRTETTDNNGSYLFDLLLPGNYQINFDISNLPESCDFTYPNVGSEFEDSDANSDGDTDCITLEAGEMNHDVDAGLIPLAKVGNYVWEDCNGDGVQTGEQGIGGIVVELYNHLGNFIARTTTNSTGQYLFDKLYPGQYYVKFLTNGYEFTTHGTGGDGLIDSDVDNSNGVGTTSIITLGPGDCEFNKFDAGLYMCEFIGDRVWFDYNENDMWDPTENGINGMKVELYRLENGSYILYDFTYTGHKPGSPSDDGYFKFCVAPGTYYVKFVNPPSTFVAAVPNFGINESVDSDVTGTFGPGTTDQISISCGQGTCDIGAGYYTMASIGDNIWMDNNGNGMRENYEAGVANVIVRAYDLSNNEIASTTSDNNGEYTITHLAKETFYLKFDIPGNMAPTAYGMGNNATIDSDINEANGPMTTSYYTVWPGTHTAHIDAGIIIGSSVAKPVVNLYGESSVTHNVIEWNVQKDMTISHYEVERAITADAEFVTIAKKLSLSNLNGDSNYDFRDYDIEACDNCLYRLRVVFDDDSYEYSEDIEIRSKNTLSIENQVSVFPNPVVDELSVDITLGSDIEHLRMDIYNMYGQVVRANAIIDLDLKAGQVTYQLDVTDIDKGIYSIKISLDKQIVTKKVIKID